jgi:hypothetical protein
MLALFSSTDLNKKLVQSPESLSFAQSSSIEHRGLVASGGSLSSIEKRTESIHSWDSSTLDTELKKISSVKQAIQALEGNFCH